MQCTYEPKEGGLCIRRKKTTSDARSPRILLRCTARNVGELEAPILQHRTKRDSHWLGAKNVEELCQMPVSLFGQELERH